WRRRWAMRPSCSEKLPRRPEHEPIHRHPGDQPGAADGLLDRESALDIWGGVRPREAEAERALRGPNVEHAGRGRNPQSGGEIDRVLRREKCVVIASLREVARRAPSRE